MTLSLEDMANALDASPDYRVQRRMPILPTLATLPHGARIACMTDTETTGIDVDTSEVIELAVVPFAYDANYRILGLLPAYEGFREPSAPIPPEITDLTGIDDDMVRGRSLDIRYVSDLIHDSTHVIAHNARFDRPFLEGVGQCFVEASWACTLREIDWKANGYEGAKLSHLLSQVGYFHDAHRAVADCHAGIVLLGTEMKDGRTALAHLIESADRTQWRIHAIGSPYDSKDILKRRGYRWAGEEGKPAKCWSKDVDDKDAEIAFLQRDVYKRPASPLAAPITARTRYSRR